MSRTLIAIVFLIASIVLGVFYASPQWTRLAETSRQIDDLTAASGQYDDLIKNRDALLASINAISKENLSRVDVALPVGAHPSEFLVALESYTVANGVSLKRVDLVSPSSEKKSSASAGPGASAKQPAASPVPSQPKPATPGASAPKTESAVSELPFGIEVSGSYEALKKFLAALEHNIRLIDVGEISFNAPIKAADPMTFTLKAKTYYQ